MLKARYLSNLSALFILSSCLHGLADDGPSIGGDDESAVDRSLVVLEKEICGKAFAVTGSGVIWTFVPEGEPRFHEGKRVSATQPLFLGYDDDLISIYEPPAKNRIAYFDQGDWHVIPWAEPLSRRDHNGPYGRIVAGVDNTVLVIGKDKTLLIRDKTVIEHGELQSLIQKHQALIRESFGQGVPHPIRRDRWRKHTLVIADQFGHIWCLHDDRLQVLVEDQWIDCRETLIEAGSRRGAIAFIVPGPDHRRFFIGDLHLRHDGGRSYIASIDKGQFVVKETYHAIEGMGLYPAIREQNEALWIASADGRSGGNSDIFTGQSAIRVDQNGELTVGFQDSGYPLVADPIGNIWLGGIRGGPASQFNIIRNGKKVQQLETPAKLFESMYELSYLPVFCNAKGSVYVHSETGLAHFLAAKKTPDHYEMIKHYALDRDRGFPRAFSIQGYCISLVAEDDVPLKKMYLTKIPEH